MLLAAVLLLSGCGAGAERARPLGQVPPQPTNVAAIELPEVRPGAPDQPFTLRARPGHLLYVYFGYVSCPDICPTTLADLSQALRRLRGDAQRVDVAFVTVDPARDTAAVLAPYLASFVAGGHPLRPATQSQLGQAEVAFGATSRVVKLASGEIQVAHTSLAYLVDERGEVLVQWDFGVHPDDLVHDIRWFLHRSAARPR